MSFPARSSSEMMRSCSHFLLYIRSMKAGKRVGVHVTTQIINFVNIIPIRHASGYTAPARS